MNTRGRLITENSTGSALGSEALMQQQITKALDLESDSISHYEILEQIKKNKLMAEEAEKNREIVEGLKASMVKLSSKVNSRSNDLGKQFQGVKE